MQPQLFPQVNANGSQSATTEVGIIANHGGLFVVRRASVRTTLGAVRQTTDTYLHFYIILGTLLDLVVIFFSLGLLVEYTGSLWGDLRSENVLKCVEHILLPEIQMC